MARPAPGRCRAAPEGLAGALAGRGGAIVDGLAFDLAALDSDGNGWIDAADLAFGQLRVWTRDGADGGDRLRTLVQAGTARALQQIDLAV